jgi:hypothetical protein
MTAPKAEPVQQAPETRKEEVKTNEKSAKYPPEQSEDKQRFIIVSACPRCGDRLVPSRGVYCQHCGTELPDEVAVHKEVVVAIKVEDYKKLAVHLKQQLNVAWSQLTCGRMVEKVSSLGQNIFLITVADEMRTSTVIQEKRLDELLAEAGIG